LPLLERHFAVTAAQLHVVEPLADTVCAHLPSRGYNNVHNLGLTKDNYKTVLDAIFAEIPSGQTGNGSCGTIRGMMVNCSVDTSSVDLAKYAQSQNLLYVDTVVEPWLGYYWQRDLTTAQRSNYALREGLLELKREVGGKGSTCVSCVGANPGMVSWLVKDALMTLARDIDKETGGATPTPSTKEEWAQLMHNLGVKGVHVAERDTQFPKANANVVNEFLNTWSVEGFLSEGFQPAELGWGTHERWMPENAKRHAEGCKAGIFLEQPGASTQVRTWCPTLGPQHGYLVTHNEAISIADYFTVEGGRGLDNPAYRPTVHYAYRPCDAAVLSFHEVFGRGNVPQPKLRVMLEKDIAGGHDELGVLLYGHSKNALWLGSTLSHEACLQLAPEQNATALQVTSAMVAALTWALKNSQRGIVESEELDHEECLAVQKPYLGNYWHQYTEWTPLDAILPNSKNVSMFPPKARTDVSDPWQFSNILV
jgi:homospermidine synthase